MATNILMPALSPTMEQGKLAKWLKREGDSVRPGDVIAEIETDKATMEVEAVDEGVIGKILVADGTENVAVNTPIAVLVGDGEDANAEAAPKPAAQPAPPAPPKVAAAPAATVVSSAPASAEIPLGTQMVTMSVREALQRNGVHTVEYEHVDMGSYYLSRLIEEIPDQKIRLLHLGAIVFGHVELGFENHSLRISLAAHHRLTIRRLRNFPILRASRRQKSEDP